MTINSINSNIYSKNITKNLNKSNEDLSNNLKIDKSNIKDNYSISINSTNKVAEPIDIFPDQDIISIYDGKKQILPSSWLSGKSKVRVDKPDINKVNNDMKDLEKALSKYPSNLIKNEVSNVYLVGNIFSGRASFYGTNSRTNLYIASKDNNEIEKTFHHEFSSILLRNNPQHFDKYSWSKLNSESLSTSSENAMRSGFTSLDFNEKLLSKGYLSDYSLSNMENDFNMYAERLFAGEKEFWEIVDKYPKVKEKTDLVIDFYNKLDHVYTESFFRSIVKN